MVRLLLIGLALGCLATVGCGSAGPVVMLHESPEGSVFLERVPDPRFQAAHPVTLSPDLLGRLLRGVRVRTESRPPDKRPAVRAFSDERIVFFAPLLAEAFSRANPDQLVRFSSARQGRSDAGAISGTLFAYGLSLHLSLSRDQDEPGAQEVLFVPEAARRPESFQQPTPRPDRRALTLVIDHQLLARLPPVLDEPVPSGDGGPAERSPVRRQEPAPSGTATDSNHARGTEATSPEQVRAMKDLIVQKDLEIQSLKADLEALRKQVTDQADQIKKLKGRQRPVPPGRAPAR